MVSHRAATFVAFAISSPSCPSWFFRPCPWASRVCATLRAAHLCLRPWLLLLLRRVAWPCFWEWCSAAVWQWQCLEDLVFWCRQYDLVCPYQVLHWKTETGSCLARGSHFETMMLSYSYLLYWYLKTLRYDFCAFWKFQFWQRNPWHWLHHQKFCSTDKITSRHTEHEPHDHVLRAWGSFQSYCLWLWTIIQGSPGSWQNTLRHPIPSECQ